MDVTLHLHLLVMHVQVVGELVLPSVDALTARGLTQALLAANESLTRSTEVGCFFGAGIPSFCKNVVSHQLMLRCVPCLCYRLSSDWC